MIPMSKELHTVPRGPFVHKKYQENFERRTHRRAIKLFDANREIVDLWLRYLKKNGIGGVGMRARVHEFVEFGFGRKEVERLEKQFEIVGGGVEGIEKAAEELIKALSEPTGGEEEHRRVLQAAKGEENGAASTPAEATSSTVSSEDTSLEEPRGDVSKGETEASISEASPASDTSPSALAESIAPPSLSPNQKQGKASSVTKDPSTSEDVPSQAVAPGVASIHKGDDSHSNASGATPIPILSSAQPATESVAHQSSTYESETSATTSAHPPPSTSTTSVISTGTSSVVGAPASNEAVKAAATAQAAPAPPESSETMGEVSALTEALDSETEPETLQGDLSVGRTAENPAEPTTGVDLTGSQEPAATASVEAVDLAASDRETELKAEDRPSTRDTKRAVKMEAEARKSEDEGVEPREEEPEKKP